MEERKSDTDETFGEQSPPEHVSDQNREEASYPHGGSGSGRAAPGGAPADESDDSSPQRSGDARHGGGGDGVSPGEGKVGGAGEGSQATGNPLNAG